MRLPTSPAGGPPDGPPDTPAAPAGAATDAAALLRQLGADPRPRLTWYGPDDQRVELTGRVLHTWVAKTAHLLLEEADVVPGSRVLVRLGADWRAPVFWLAAWYLGAQVLHQDQGAPADVDVVALSQVRGDSEAARSTTAVLVVVPPGAVAAPAEGLPPGAVDFGGEVSGFPDVPPAPGPRTPLGPPAAEARRVLVGPEGSPDRVVATWAAGGSVVLHTGLPAAALERVAAQERTDP